MSMSLCRYLVYNYACTTALQAIDPGSPVESVTLEPITGECVMLYSVSCMFDSVEVYTIFTSAQVYTTVNCMYGKCEVSGFLLRG